MSSYRRFTKHPETHLWENAMWLDDYYGRYFYGVRFSDEKVFDPYKVVLETGINEEEAEVLNDYQKHGEVLR